MQLKQDVTGYLVHLLLSLPLQPITDALRKRAMKMYRNKPETARTEVREDKRASESVCLASL